MHVFADVIARQAIAELQDQLRAGYTPATPEASQSVQHEIRELRDRVEALQQENAALKAYLIPEDPKVARLMEPLALNAFIHHVAGELDRHAAVINWLKKHTSGLMDWERDSLAPFCHSVHNRLRDAEMVIEEFIGADPELKQKFERIKKVIGRVDYHHPEPGPHPKPGDAPRA